ncbi:MAG: hypothetical protein M3134_00330 [Actinomycetota bacterium]|nr:hypothetical protein [Actinomycetota bacterium]
MGFELLADIDAKRVFESTRRFEDLDLFHVPFDELTGRAVTEDVLLKTVAADGKIALLGGSGGGKSSVLSFALGPYSVDIPDHLVPIRIPVAAEGQGLVTDANAFARYVLGRCTKWASVDLLTEGERRSLEAANAKRIKRFSERKTRKFSLATPGWLADLGFAREVAEAGTELERDVTASDAVDALGTLVSIFHSHGLSPFFVIDDSDAWLTVPGVGDRTGLANDFFLNALQLLIREIDCGFAATVHNEYLDLAGYRQIRGMLSREIEIPDLGDRAGEAIAKILARRLDYFELNATPTDVFTEDGITGLEWHYHSDPRRSLRDVLRVADRAVQHACSGQQDVVTKELVILTVAELR